MTLEAGLSLDAFKDASTRSGAVCVVRKIREALSSSDRATVDAAIADESVTATAIARVLSDAGHPVRAASVAYHRRGECRCEMTP